ncbi:hypothetical protein [Latilactobacillus curvatus]|uniref:hypothetical protein n=1 Tax=Latilactobacillus curvatus TaxID=28038 RepID=UPI001F3D2DBF|nr:hypothetical protein [Latilactobacillus curvatus]
MEREYQSRASLKKEVKSLFAGHWGKAVTLNIIPTLLSIIGVIIVGVCEDGHDCHLRKHRPINGCQ